MSLDDRYHHEWQYISRYVRAVFNHHCAYCGKDCQAPTCQDDVLQVHHIDENPGNNEFENLIPLCAVCHLRIEKEARLHAPHQDRQLELFADLTYAGTMQRIREIALVRYGGDRISDVSQMSPEDYEDYEWEMEENDEFRSM